MVRVDCVDGGGSNGSGNTERKSVTMHMESVFVCVRMTRQELRMAKVASSSTNVTAMLIGDTPAFRVHAHSKNLTIYRSHYLVFAVCCVASLPSQQNNQQHGRNADVVEKRATSAAAHEDHDLKS